MDGLHPSLSPDRRETAEERQDARLSELCQIHRTLDEFAAWFGGDLADPDRADDEAHLAEVRAVVAWLNSAPADIRAIAIPGMRRTRIGLARWCRDQPAIEIMGVTLPAVRSVREGV